ncbi:MAG: MFS transporter [Actinomyces urogenitalis]|uniref:MFS transporter n=1 Tax=Actinomyces urogenitalis TaxID=103621 RepID=UPI002A8030E6|nr:MFS transporter [Actinomyces urogenitalis]MDY3679304.1 MFS transporter [Actinomyces urogenitalis]
MSQSRPALAVQRPTAYRWVVLAIIFLGYVVCMADRSNVGAVLPYIKDEFHISNFASGAISSFFFLGYAISQIPAGLMMEKWGVRSIVSIAVLLFSIVTFAMGYTTTAVALIVLRLLLGLAEGATPVGMTTTINNWFPRHEKGTATGVYIASTQLAPMIVPMIAVLIAEAAGWRAVFHWFAIPGVILAAVFYFFVRTHPSESRFTNDAEVTYISTNTGGTREVEFGDMGWIDRVIRLRSVPALDSNGKVLRSWNVWGVTLGYFCMNNVLYGMITWIPSYLKESRGYDALNMGLMSATPFIGGLVGALLGGWVSDHIFRSRRKPTMMITALGTAVLMAIVLVIPNNTALLGTCLFLTGFCLNIGWSAFTSYAMNVTTTRTYPFAISIINSGGNLGGFFAPMIVGALLDATGSYNIAFSYYVAVLVIAFILMFSITEARPQHAEA